MVSLLYIYFQTRINIIIMNEKQFIKNTGKFNSQNNCIATCCKGGWMIFQFSIVHVHFIFC